MGLESVKIRGEEGVHQRRSAFEGSEKIGSGREDDLEANLREGASSRGGKERLGNS